MARIPKLAQISTRLVTTIPIMLGFVCIFIETLLYKQYSGHVIEDVLIGLTFFFWGLSGLPMIIRKEGFGDMGIEALAIINGIILLVIFWGIDIAMLYFLFIH
jgi:hypothetical protein